MRLGALRACRGPSVAAETPARSGAADRIAHPTLQRSRSAPTCLDMDDHLALEELTRRLWAERRSVTHLLNTLGITQPLLLTDDRTFVSDVLTEVERALLGLRSIQAHRVSAMHNLATLWRIAAEELSIDVLASNAPPLYDEILREHGRAFADLVGRIERLEDLTRYPGLNDLAHLNDTLDALHIVASTTCVTADTSRATLRTSFGAHA